MLLSIPITYDQCLTLLKSSYPLALHLLRFPHLIPFPFTLISFLLYHPIPPSLPLVLPLIPMDSIVSKAVSMFLTPLIFDFAYSSIVMIIPCLDTLAKPKRWISSGENMYGLICIDSYRIMLSLALYALVLSLLTINPMGFSNNFRFLRSHGIPCQWTS